MTVDKVKLFKGYENYFVHTDYNEKGPEKVFKNMQKKI